MAADHRLSRDTSSGSPRRWTRPTKGRLKGLGRYATMRNNYGSALQCANEPLLAGHPGGRCRRAFMNRREFTKSALMLGVMAQTSFGDAKVKAAPAEPANDAPAESVESSPQIAFVRAE